MWGIRGVRSIQHFSAGMMIQASVMHSPMIIVDIMVLQIKVSSTIWICDSGLIL